LYNYIILLYTSKNFKYNTVYQWLNKAHSLLFFHTWSMHKRPNAFWMLMRVIKYFLINPKKNFICFRLYFNLTFTIYYLCSIKLITISRGRKMCQLTGFPTGVIILLISFFGQSVRFKWRTKKSWKKKREKSYTNTNRFNKQKRYVIFFLILFFSRSPANNSV